MGRGMRVVGAKGAPIPLRDRLDNNDSFLYRYSVASNAPSDFSIGSLRFFRRKFSGRRAGGEGSHRFSLIGDEPTRARKEQKQTRG